MSAPLLSHPFRLMPNGSIAALHSDSDQYVAERLALILAVRPGERPLVPLFGINDPSFSELSTAALEAQVEAFGIPANIHLVTKTVINDSLVDYQIEFDTNTTGGQ